MLQENELRIGHRNIRTWLISWSHIFPYTHTWRLLCNVWQYWKNASLSFLSLSEEFSSSGKDSKSLLLLLAMGFLLSSISSKWDSLADGLFNSFLKTISPSKSVSSSCSFTGLFTFLVTALLPFSWLDETLLSSSTSSSSVTSFSTALLSLLFLYSWACLRRLSSNILS